LSTLTGEPALTELLFLPLQVPVSQRGADNAVKREVAAGEAAGGITESPTSAAKMR